MAPDLPAELLIPQVLQRALAGDQAGVKALPRQPREGAQVALCSRKVCMLMKVALCSRKVCMLMNHADIHGSSVRRIAYRRDGGGGGACQDAAKPGWTASAGAAAHTPESQNVGDRVHGRHRYAAQASLPGKRLHCWTPPGRMQTKGCYCGPILCLKAVTLRHLATALL